MRIRIAALVGLAQIAAACGSSSTHGPRADETVQVDAGSFIPKCAPFAAGDGVDHGAPSTTFPAPHPALPTLVNQEGNPVLAAPKTVLVLYPSYVYASQLETFARTLGAQGYWSDAVGEYGVGPISYVETKVLTGQTPPATITDADIEKLVGDDLAAGTFGVPDASTIYTIVFPSTTTITFSGPLGDAKSCDAFGGYHGDVAVSIGGSTQNYAYAVMPTCASFGDLVGIDAVTGALSHEWAEASTDPFPTTNGGFDSSYVGVDADHLVWALLGGAEDGDLCAQRRESFFKPNDFAFTVQSVWSNRAAAAGGDPCAPKRPGIYFNAAPVLPERVDFGLSGIGGTTQRTLGVKIPKGGSATIEVDLFSDEDTAGPWTVEAHDLSGVLTGGPPTLTFGWDRSCGQNGEKLHLSLTVLATSSLGTSHPFLLVSTRGEQIEAWPALAVEE